MELLLFSFLPKVAFAFLLILTGVIVVETVFLKKRGGKKAALLGFVFVLVLSPVIYFAARSERGEEKKTKIVAKAQGGAVLADEVSVGINPVNSPTPTIYIPPIGGGETVASPTATSVPVPKIPTAGNMTPLLAASGMGILLILTAFAF